MKKHFTGFLALLTALLLAVPVFAGCGSAQVPADTAVVFEGEVIPEDVAKLYVYTTQLDVEKENEWMVMLYYGDYEKFWAAEFGDGTYAEQGRRLGISRLIQTKTLLSYAKQKKITLEDADEAKLVATYEKFKEDHSASIKKAGVSDELVRQFLRDNALANKAFLSIVSSIDTSFSDEDNTKNRRKSGEGISVYAKASYKESDEEDAKTIEVSEEDQEKARKEAMEDIFARMKAGEDLSDIVTDYRDNRKDLTVGNLGSISASPENARQEDATDYTSYSQRFWEMSSDEYASFEITNSAELVNGYLLHCINDDDPELRKQAEAEMLELRKQDTFTAFYPGLAKKHGKYHVYETITDNIKIEEPLYGGQAQPAGN